MFERLKSWMTRAETSALSRPTQWLISTLSGGVSSYSGVTMSRDKALTYSAIFAAVNIISGDVARLPLSTFRVSGKDEIEDTNHPLYRPLHNSPNPEMSSFTWRRASMVHILLHGNAYSYIDRSGPEIEFWPIDPLTVQPDRNPRDRRLIYRVSTEEGEVTLEADEMLHLKGLSVNGIIGLSVIGAARNSFGHGIAMQEYSARFFSNNATPGYLFIFPKGVKKETRDDFLKQWQKQTSLANAHKAAALNEDIVAKSLSIPAKDAQLIEGMDWSIRDIANWFSIPPHLLGDSSRTAYNSLAQENQSYLNRTLAPHLVNWEAELNLKFGDGDVTVKHHRPAILDLDPGEQSDILNKALGGKGWMSVPEGRRIQGLPAKMEPDPNPPTDPGVKPPATAPAQNVNTPPANPAQGGQQQ